MMERNTLIQLVTEAQRGKPGAMERLFEAFYNDVYYFALKTVKDEELACDITQETFAAILSTIRDLKEPAAFITWMRQVAYSQCTRYFRKQRELLVDEDEEGGTVFDVVPEERTDFIPGEALDQEDFRKTILGLLDELSPEQRSAVMLYYYDELSVKQIAQIQGVSEGTVKSRLNYARKAIKTLVEDYEKRNDVKLHSVALLPLLYWVFAQSRRTMPAGAAQTAAAGITASAAAGAKALSIPLAAKIVAGVAAVSIAAGGVGIALSRNSTPAEPEQSISGTVTEPPETTAPVILGDVVPDGCFYIQADGTVLEAGARMPAESAPGDRLKTEVYEYWMNEGWWSVKAVDKTLKVYPALYSEINRGPLMGVNEAFQFCQNMTEAPAIPNTVLSLERTFEGCTALEEIPALPMGIMTMYSTFKDCTALRVAPEIPAGVSWMQYTFEGCTALERGPALPEGIVSLYGVFKDCTTLKTAPALPSTVTNINDLFMGCTALEAPPVIPAGVESMQAAFMDCTSLRQPPMLPEGLVNMAHAFQNCKSMTERPRIPDSVTNMAYAFEGAG